MEINIFNAFVDEIGVDINNLCSICGPENVTIDQIYTTGIINPEYWHDQMISELTGSEIRNLLEIISSTKYHGSNTPSVSFVQTMLMELQDCDRWNDIVMSKHLSNIHLSCTKEINEKV